MFAGSSMDNTMGAVLAMNERLFSGTDKDVELKCSDGSIHAHKCVLRAVSDVFAAALEHDMQESATNVIVIDDVDLRTMRVFLRLLYTGHVAVADWQSTEIRTILDAVDRSTTDRTQSEEAKADMRAFRDALQSYAKAKMFEDDDGLYKDFSRGKKISAAKFRERMWELLRVDFPQVVGSAGPAAPDFTEDRLAAIFRHLDADNDGFISKDEFRAMFTSKMVVKQEAIITNHFELAQSTSFHKVVPGELIETFWNERENEFKSVRSQCRVPGNETTGWITIRSYGDGGMDGLMPVEILLSIGQLAKRYMTQGVLSLVMEALKPRLKFTKLMQDVVLFDKILSAAIRSDFGALRFNALGLAGDNFDALKRSYDENKLCAEVQAELQAIWPMPPPPPAKRVRIA